MSDWKLSCTDRYERDYKQYEKKHTDELIAILDNLDSYFNALDELGNPCLIKSGFIHPESHGIIAIDQKGGKRRVKLQQTRLYIYPDIQNKTLYLLAIGDKNSQKKDIQSCIDIVKQIKKENPHG
jgi:mRNA-degrading endonuclease RelE of RelBE toxin-antitoxin system